MVKFLGWSKVQVLVGYREIGLGIHRSGKEEELALERRIRGAKFEVQLLGTYSAPSLSHGARTRPKERCYILSSAR